jgi:deazaflavin-dependent oxidoreductase (nitroreductase family)
MPFPRILSRYTQGYFNRLVLRHLVGHLAFADLEHVGRRSGIVRHTPVRAFRRNDQVVIGVNFGRESDWLKNIQAAGRCRMRLGGAQLELGAPRVVPVRQGIRGVPWIFGVAIRYVARTTDCVVLPVTGSGQAGLPHEQNPPE